ncbi:phytoene/squalene synthase family protein [Nocardia sp. NPDC024068]|uniref:phytoene/squalene synthase family protein n=1 Tax=Nocardia sp. NPDC024068 TaxID=3157197 RepID=UPI0033D5A180
MPGPAGPDEIRDAYRRCRRVAAQYGRSYYLATRLLSAGRRPAVHALYAFARTVDDIVDNPDTRSTAATLDALDAVETRLTAIWSPIPPPATSALPAEFGPVLLALTDTVRRFEIEERHFTTFLHSMRMDVPGSPRFRSRYPSMAALNEYMRGSAAAIGLQLLPVLGTVVPRADAEPAAAALGNAFQLTNFLRDIGEDLDRDRIYLPADALAAFGVDEKLLRHCRTTGRTESSVRRALAHLVAVNRDLYRVAAPGVDLLTPRVRPAIRAAARLYGAILDRIEEDEYAVFARRAVVPNHRRLRLAAGAAIAG